MIKDAALKAAKVTLKSLTAREAGERMRQPMNDEQWQNYLGHTRTIVTDQPSKASLSTKRTIGQMPTCFIEHHSC